MNPTGLSPDPYSRYYRSLQFPGESSQGITNPTQQEEPSTQNAGRDERWRGLSPQHVETTISLSPPTISTNDLLRAFYDAGIRYNCRIKDTIILSRLHGLNTRPEPYLAAINIAKTLNHPTMSSLNADITVSLQLLTTLAAIIRNRGPTTKEQSVFLNSNDHPENLVMEAFRKLQR